MKPINNYITISRNIIVAEFKKLRQYQLNFLGQFIFLPVKILIVYMLWSTIFAKQGELIIGGYNETTIVLYYVFIAIIEFMINPFCVITFELYQDVRSGRIDIFFSKPISYLVAHFFNKFGNLIIGYIYYLILIFITFFWGSYSITNVILSFFATIIGCIILFSLFAIIGSMTFIYENVLTLRDNVWNVIKLLSGVLIPISFYPNGLRKIINFMPFRYIYSFPVEIILQTINKDTIIFNFFLSLCWMIILLGLLNLMWRKAIKYHTSQGG